MLVNDMMVIGLYRFYSRRKQSPRRQMIDWDLPGELVASNRNRMFLCSRACTWSRAGGSGPAGSGLGMHAGFVCFGLQSWSWLRCWGHCQIRSAFFGVPRCLWGPPLRCPAAGAFVPGLRIVHARGAASLIRVCDTYRCAFLRRCASSGSNDWLATGGQTL